MGANVGSIIAKLDALGVRDRTIVMFIGDNAPIAARSSPPFPARGATRNPPAPVTIGFETPYALVGDTEVTSTTARAFGHDIARALAAYLKDSRP